MTLIDGHTGEILTHMSAASARRLTDEIRETLTVAYDKLVEAWRGRADLALGYESWDAYCAAEFSEARMLRPTVEQRREIVASMRGEGMSTRAIGSALGTDARTVRRDLGSTEASAPDEQPATVTSLDGRQRPAARPAYDPPPMPTPEAQAVYERDRAAQTSREAWSQNLARSVWMLAQFATTENAVEKAVEEWQPSQDIFPKPTTAERMRAAAVYLNQLAEGWPQ